MKNIIPAILSNTEADFLHKINHPLTKLVDFIQIDILDGSLFSSTSWHQPSAVPADLSTSIELHLMVDAPEVYIEAWSEVKQVKRAYIHAELDQDLSFILSKIYKNNWQAGIAINPETPISEILKYSDEITHALIMGVQPGASGRPFYGEEILAKVTELKKIAPDLIISIDGGISSENIALVVEAGIENICIGSALWKAESPESALQELVKLI
jgi:ribulose-phosphate 3-epimerase